MSARLACPLQNVVGWLSRTRRTWFGWGALKGALGSGSEAGINPCHAHLPVTKISARVRQNRTWAVAGRAPGPWRREAGARIHQIHPHQGRAERMTSEPASEKPAAPLPGRVAEGTCTPPPSQNRT